MIIIKLVCRLLRVYEANNFIFGPKNYFVNEKKIFIIMASSITPQMLFGVKLLEFLFYQANKNHM